jgi:hypothetical protein
LDHALTPAEDNHRKPATRAARDLVTKKAFEFDSIIPTASRRPAPNAARHFRRKMSVRICARKAAEAKAVRRGQGTHV